MSEFLLRRYSDGVAVIRVTGAYQAKTWNPKEYKWVPIGSDWMGFGGATNFEDATEEEAAQALLDLGVKPDELEPVMLGLDPETSPLAQAMMSARRRTSP